METLKDRFAYLARLKPDITQADIARAADVKPPSVNGWFTGASKSIRAAPAAAVAALYGVDPYWLATGIGSPVVTTIPQKWDDPARKRTYPS